MLTSLLASVPISTPYTLVAAGLLTTVFLHKNVQRGDVALVSETAFFVAIFAAYRLTLGLGISASAWLAATAIFYHISTVVLATVAYRLSPFHPLWNFPGPLINKMTSLKMLFVVWSGKRHLYIDGLHKKYGKFVRTGPNTLTIDSYEAISPLYASANALDKSDAYTPGRMEGNGLFFIKSKEEHNVRRRLWAGAFTTQTIEGYKPVIEKRTNDLVNCVTSRRDANAVVDLSEAIQHWSYDVMGDLSFGGSNRLELMQDGDPEELIYSGQEATVVFETLGEVPSLFDLLTYLPFTGYIKKLERAAEKLLVIREKDTGSNQSDLVSHLLGHHAPNMPKLNFSDRRIDSLFAIQAGSDTTSGVIIYMFFLLISNKHAYERLREELDANFSDPTEHIPANTLATLPYLNAVVYESLRLGTPLPGLPRVTPKGGLMIEDTYIPEGMIVGVNPYVQETSPENFYPDPMAYRPERWLPEGLGPGTVTRKGAIMSFSFGAFGCLGRNLAIQELQIVCARLMLTFDFAFAPDFDPKKFMDGVENMRATIFRYPLTVIATPRK